MLTHNPLDLLRDAVPVWVDVLRPGGALGVAWNTYVAARDDALAVLAAAGLEVLDGGAYRAFPHRVDQATRGTCWSLGGRFRLSACRWTGTTPLS